MSALIRTFQWLEKRTHRFFFFIAAIVAIVALYVFRSMWGGPGEGASSPALRAWSDTRDIAYGLRGYYAANEKWPDGDLATISAALKGDNPTQAVFVFEIPRNTSGAFVDPWGTPYRIDLPALGGPRVYSFGPNKTDDSASAGSDDIASWR